MNTIRIILFFSTLLLFSFSNAQDYCEILKKEDIILDFNNNSLKNKLYKLTNCGIDSLEIATYFNLKLVENIMFSNLNITEQKYSDIINEIKKLKITDDFIKLKKATEASTLLSKKKFNPKNWSDDKKLLSNAGLTEFEIMEFYNYLIKLKTQNKTFTKLYKQFLLKPNLKNKIEIKEEDNIPINKHAIIEDAYYESLKKSKLERTNVLVFFYYPLLPEGENQKMFNKIFSNKKVKKLIKKFITLYFITNSEEQIIFKKSKFNTEEKVYFVIVSHKGEIVAEQFLTENKQKFIAFLKKGLKK